MADKNKQLFEQEKKSYLQAKLSNDKSKKGEIDARIKALIYLINSFSDYYTTSSCSGRILLLKSKAGQRKYNCKWLVLTHDYAKPKEFIDALDSCKGKFSDDDLVSFRMESSILHIVCFDVLSAQRLVDIAKLCGFKRSGIMASKRRVVVEIISTESIDNLLVISKVYYGCDDYIKALVDVANKRLFDNWKKLEKFEKELKKLKKS